MTPSDPAGPASAARTVRVPDDRAGQRLDNFLLGQLKGAPRSLVYKLVRSGQVRVNGGRAKAERKLEAGDEVRIPPVRLADPAEKGAAPPGLLVLAKKRSALSELQALMREDGGITKRYLALLVGRLPDGVLTVDAPLQ